MDVQDNSLVGWGLLHQFLAFFTFLDYFIDQLRQEPPFLTAALLLGRRDDLHFLGLSLLPVVAVLSLISIIFLLSLLLLVLVPFLGLVNCTKRG